MNEVRRYRIKKAGYQRAPVRELLRLIGMIVEPFFTPNSNDTHSSLLAALGQGGSVIGEIVIPNNNYISSHGFTEDCMIFFRGCDTKKRVYGCVWHSAPFAHCASPCLTLEHQSFGFALLRLFASYGTREGIS